MNIALGIDFGTTNSVVAVIQDSEVNVIKIERIGSLQTLKSVLFFDENQSISIGQEAIDYYLEYSGSYGRFMQSIKTFLPSKSFTETYVFGQKYTLEELIALILKEIRHRGELHIGHVVDTVVLGRPVVFSENKEEDLLAEERLRSAANIAGFSNVSFVYEPIAATLSYESTLQKGEEKLVFMGDFGGGTSDFVAMRLHGGLSNPAVNRKKDILATGGVYIGGDSFDASIMWHKIAQHFGKGVTYKSTTQQTLDIPIWIPKTLCQWHLIPSLRERKTLNTIRTVKVSADNKESMDNLETLVLENLGYMVFRSIETAKCELSKNDVATISFAEKGILFEEKITRDEFSQMINEHLIHIEQCIDDVMEKSGMYPSDIDIVLLTGGTSFIPAVRNIFVKKFGEEKLKPIDAFTSVAYGLGLSAL